MILSRPLIFFVIPSYRISPISLTFDDDLCEFAKEVPSERDVFNDIVRYTRLSIISQKVFTKFIENNLSTKSNNY